MNMRMALPFVLAAFVCACGVLPSDIVEHTYPTLADARRDNLFDKGWLPDILPPSTVGIRTENNLDVNTSFGEFSFAPEEAPLLMAKLKWGAAPMRFVDWDETVKEYADDGYAAWSYRDDDTMWTFFCDFSIARCEYSMRWDRAQAIAD
ncbi:MAG: hypothetical protein IT473_14150 [Lysobacter sp.]|nr:hypothetical protein [Lysobacter sp.]